MRRCGSRPRGTRSVRAESVEPLASRGPLRLASRALATLVAAAFVALLVFGLLSKATNHTIDDSIQRSGSAAAPALHQPVLERGSLGPALSAKVGPALAGPHVTLSTLRGTPVV